jgi:hypothetical protein
MKEQAANPALAVYAVSSYGTGSSLPHATVAGHRLYRQRRSLISYQTDEPTETRQGVPFEACQLVPSA